MSRRRLLAAIAVVVAIAVVTPVAPATADTTRTSTPGAVISAYYDSGQWSKAIAAVVK
jgi:hypothetical protein